MNGVPSETIDDDDVRFALCTAAEQYFCCEVCWRHENTVSGEGTCGRKLREPSAVHSLALRCVLRVTTDTVVAVWWGYPTPHPTPMNVIAQLPLVGYCIHQQHGVDETPLSPVPLYRIVTLTSRGYTEIFVSG